MLMHMPTRNVYVSEPDLPVFDAAAQLAGSLSTAVAAGLRLYLAEREKQQGRHDMKTIEVDVDEGPIVATKRFAGRQLLRWSAEDGTRSHSFRIFRTANDQFAVYARDDPNWAAISDPADDNPIWNNPKTWGGDWWRKGRRELKVFATIADMRGVLPDELVAAVGQAVEHPPVEDLDI